MLSRRGLTLRTQWSGKALLRMDLPNRVLKEMRGKQVDIWGKSIPDRGKSKCKDPKAEVCLVNWKKSRSQCGGVV